MLDATAAVDGFEPTGTTRTLTVKDTTTTALAASGVVSKKTA